MARRVQPVFQAGSGSCRLVILDELSYDEAVD